MAKYIYAMLKSMKRATCKEKKPPVKGNFRNDTIYRYTERDFLEHHLCHHLYRMFSGKHVVRTSMPSGPQASRERSHTLDRVEAS
jgi:hypothetical protein